MGACKSTFIIHPVNQVLMKRWDLHCVNEGILAVET